MPLSRVLFPGEEEEEEARFSFAAGGGADGGRDGRTDGGARLVVKSVTLSEQLGKEGRKEGRKARRGSVGLQQLGRPKVRSASALCCRM